MGMDEREQENLQRILDRLNRAETENRELKAEIKKSDEDMALTRSIMRYLSGEVVEVDIKFRNYFRCGDGQDE